MITGKKEPLKEEESYMSYFFGFRISSDVEVLSGSYTVGSVYCSRYLLSR